MSKRQTGIGVSAAPVAHHLDEARRLQLHEYVRYHLGSAQHTLQTVGLQDAVQLRQHEEHVIHEAVKMNRIPKSTILKGNNELIYAAGKRMNSPIHKGREVFGHFIQANYELVIQVFFLQVRYLTRS